MALTTFTSGQVLTAAQMNALQANDYNQTVSTKTASYTLVAADKGTRVVMNSASATTITVNTSLFNAGDTLFIQNTGAGGTCTITAGTATVTTAGSLALGAWAGGTLYFTSASAAVFFSGSGSVYGTATGGSSSSITVSGVDYTLLTFTSTGTLTIVKSGVFDFCAVGGGGGSAYIGATYAGGGGGAGQVSMGQIYLDANQTITIGAGSAAFQWDNFSQGGNTTIGTPSPFNPAGIGNISGTSNGGGGSVYIGGGAGGANARPIFTISASTLIGFKGGNSTSNTNGGGGGGQSGAGGNGATTAGGTGGTGFDRSAFIGGSASFIAVGGGGSGTVTVGAAATGGVAGSTTGTGNNGAANTGCGGGGLNGAFVAGGSGGSGICYIRFKV